MSSTMYEELFHQHPEIVPCEANIDLITQAHDGDFTLSALEQTVRDLGDRLAYTSVQPPTEQEIQAEAQKAYRTHVQRLKKMSPEELRKLARQEQLHRMKTNTAALSKAHEKTISQLREEIQAKTKAADSASVYPTLPL